MPIFRGEAQTQWSWAPKKQHNLPVGTAVLWNSKAAIKAHTARQQNSKLSNSCSLPKQCSSLHNKNPRAFFSRGKKIQWTCKWGQSEKYAQYISAFSKLREHFWECKYSTQTLQRHTVPAASEWQILPFPPRVLTPLRHSSRTATHPLVSWHLIRVGRVLPCKTTNFTPPRSRVLPGSKGMVISQHLEGQNVPPNSTKASRFLTCLLAVLALLPPARSVSLVQMLQPDPRSPIPDPRAGSLREQFSISPLQTGHFHSVSSMLPVISVSWQLTAAGSSCSHLHFPFHPAPVLLPSDPRICCLPAKMKYSAITVSKP